MSLFEKNAGYVSSSGYGLKFHRIDPSHSPVSFYRTYCGWYVNVSKSVLADSPAATDLCGHCQNLISLQESAERLIKGEV